MKKLIAALAFVLTFSACTPQEVIVHIFPNEVGKAISVADCESKFNASVTGGPNPNGTYDHGLFQINDIWNQPGHHDEVADWIGRHWHLRHDPVYNALMAKKIRQKYGWGMWSCN